MLYRISKETEKTQIAPVPSTNLATEGLYEVKDLSQWLVANPRLLSYRVDESEVPHVIGYEVPIAPEFRVDVLAVDADATLVVCEVKRDENDPLYQGLQYCGRLFSMPTAELVALVEERTGQELAQLQANLDLPEDSTLSEMWDAGRRAIRLVIVAQDYPPQVFQTARWLATTGLRVSCIRFDCFKDGTSLYLSPQQILPSVETAESYALQREAAHRQAQVRTRNMFYSLIVSGRLSKGEPVYSQEGKEIGVVREDHIERLSDGVKCVNFFQLTNISASSSACVQREGQMKTIGELRQGTLPAQVPEQSAGTPAPEMPPAPAVFQSAQG